MTRSTSTARDVLAATGVDGVALKPSECDVRRALDVDVDVVTVDYEGREHVPGRDVLASLAADRSVRLTTPVRAAGYDPEGNASLTAAIPDDVGRVLVAGHGAYLDDEEQARSIAPRLGNAAGNAPDAWVGTESVERLALATGATQFELLSRSTRRDVRGLRAAGFDGEIAVYAPTVLSTDDDVVLDAVGDYAARRGPVARALPGGAATDAAATGRAREVLSSAVRDYALVGGVETVAERVTELHDLGVDHVVAYPARGIDAVAR